MQMRRHTGMAIAMLSLLAACTASEADSPSTPIDDELSSTTNTIALGAARSQLSVRLSATLAAQGADARPVSYQLSLVQGTLAPLTFTCSSGFVLYGDAGKDIPGGLGRPEAGEALYVGRVQCERPVSSDPNVNADVGPNTIEIIVSGRITAADGRPVSGSERSSVELGLHLGNGPLRNALDEAVVATRGTRQLPDWLDGQTYWRIPLQAAPTAVAPLRAFAIAARGALGRPMTVRPMVSGRVWESYSSTTTQVGNVIGSFRSARELAVSLRVKDEVWLTPRERDMVRRQLRYVTLDPKDIVSASAMTRWLSDYLATNSIKPLVD